MTARKSRTPAALWIPVGWTLLLVCGWTPVAGGQSADEAAEEPELAAADSSAEDLVEEPAEAAPPPADIEEDADPQIRADIEQLRLLLAGEMPLVDIQQLFDADLQDDQSVDTLLRSIRAQMEQAEDERTVLRASLQAEEDGTPGEDDGGEASEEAGEEVATATQTADMEARLAMLGLVIQRGELRQAFLSRPRSERISVLESIEQRRRLEEERSAAVLAREEAEKLATQAAEARQEALAEASHARSEAIRVLANARADVEAVRAAVAVQRAVYAGDRTRGAETSDDLLHLAESYEYALSKEYLPPAEADALYDEVVPMLAESRRELGEALDELVQPSRYPGYELEIDLADRMYREQSKERDALLQTIAELEAARLDAEEDEQAYRWSRVEVLAQQTRQLSDYHLGLLPYLSPVKRERVLGIGPRGLEQAGREIGQLQLMCRWYYHARIRNLGEAPTWLIDVMARSSSRWDALVLLTLLMVSLTAYRRRTRLLTGINRFVRAQTEGRRLAAATRRWVASFNAIAVDLGLLLVVWLGFDRILQLTTAAEVLLARKILLTYAGYRFCLAVLHRFFVLAATQSSNKITAELSERIRRSVRLVAYFMFAVVVFLRVAEQVFGPGYLYLLVQDFFWVGAFPIGLVLFRRWKDGLFDTYLRFFPEGRLADWIGAVRERWLAYVVGIPVLLLLLVRAGGKYLQTLVLRFERTRKTLAYLNRRKLENQAVEVGHGTRDVAQLPGALRQRFAFDGSRRIDHYPQLDRALKRVERFQERGQGFALALVGRRGVGKTTWLRDMQRRVDVPVIYAELENSLDTEDAVCRSIGRIIGAKGTDTVEACVAALNRFPPHILLLDCCQNVVLRAVGGADGLEAIAQILRRTVHRHGYVCAFSRHVWEYLEFASRGQDVFTRVLRLEGWPEERIKELIESRLESSGFQVDYGDLVSDDVRVADPEQELARTRERYMRLLWDYSDGIPALAMHFWLRSLVPDEGTTLRVRLFDGPVPDDLEKLQEQSRFMLNAIVSNETLSLAEAVRVLHYPADECLSILELLTAQGYLNKDDDQYSVSTDWDLAVVRYLRRKHLLHS